jgi:hypothetical protein
VRTSDLIFINNVSETNCDWLQTPTELCIGLHLFILSLFYNKGQVHVTVHLCVHA